MRLSVSKTSIIVLLMITATVSACLFGNGEDDIDYNTQVKPIINKQCISCHGGVKQEGGFSLLFREEALAKTSSGRYAIIPGNAAGSELIRRIKETNAEERMPFKHDALSEKEIEIFEQWINQGAKWGTHWAYLPVEEIEVPEVNDRWIKNDIDKFIVQKLKEEKLTPSPEADKATILRRVSLDLIGLQPPATLAKSFLNNPSPQAYNILIDSLLASPAYGEKWTSMWLDLARYGDTKGYESDQPRRIWRYKDWVIKAFNADKPYNTFLIEQIAGDLMPGSDDDKYIATAFHRNTMNNDEGGTENEEFRISAVIDRVNTTWSALMGTTFNCVQCHSHPYDPFKMEEYYQFMAFFNNTRDEDLPAEYPLLRFYKGNDSAQYHQLTAWLQQNASSTSLEWYNLFLRTIQPSVNSHLCDNYTKGLLYQKNYAGLDAGGTCRLPGITTTDKAYMLFRYVNNKNNTTLKLYADSLKGNLLATIPLADTRSRWKIEMHSLPAMRGTHDLWFEFVCASNRDNSPLLFDWFAFAPQLNEETGFSTFKTSFTQLLNSETDGMPVMLENNEEQRRKTYLFERGNWFSRTKEVQPGVPSIMNAFPEGAPTNRLGLALWLTDFKNPLTARTMVNRLWEQLFGTGLAQTLEDLGTQGEPPYYQALLDYLSWKFMHEYKWSIKKLLKEIVSSSVYRQSSVVNEDLYKKDPANVLLARMSRVRLTGEQLRDQTLAVSGLLSSKMYGAGVMPYQPEGIWQSPYNSNTWKLSEGEDRYRRAVYTYWKRTAPYPSMINFDGASREVCMVRRIRTNTPLQALNTLNDSAYLVMARNMASAINQQKQGSAADKIAFAYHTMFYKNISSGSLKALRQLYDNALYEYNANAAAANTIMGDKDKPAKPEDAAMMVVTNALFNLDEWLNKN